MDDDQHFQQSYLHNGQQFEQQYLNNEQYVQQQHVPQYTTQPHAAHQHVFASYTAQGLPIPGSIMPYISPTTARLLAANRAMDPNDKRVLQGNFIKVSKAVTSRPPNGNDYQSSPEGTFQPSFTISQMERLDSGLFAKASLAEKGLRGRFIADDTEPTKRDPESKSVGSSARSRSPVKNSFETPCRLRGRSPTKASNNSKGSGSRRIAFEFDENSFIRSSSPKREPPRQAQQRSILKETTPTPVVAQPSPLSQRVHQVLPPPIDTEIARQDAKRAAAYRNGKAPVVVHNPPPPAPAAAVQCAKSETSSVYSDHVPHVSPLRITKRTATPAATAAPAPPPREVSILQGYRDWRNTPCVAEPRSYSSDMARSREDPKTGSTPSTGFEPVYNPIVPFMNDDLPGVRKVSKTLIGHNGWLESTSKPPQQSPSPTRKTGFLNNMFKKAKVMMTGDSSKSQRKSHESGKTTPRSLAISLNPREQSLLYCELEFALTSALNDYLVTEFSRARLDPHKLKKIADAWQAQGRPKVTGFRYDLETQLELIRAHVDDFKFYGRTAVGAAVLGILDMMTANARVLRVRTFCQPDTVIAKQILDSQHLFNTLGCSEAQQLQLADITGFFKAALQRERALVAQEQQRESATTNELSLRHAKSHSGERGPMAGRDLRRISSYGVMKMDPTDYDADNVF